MDAQDSYKSNGTRPVGASQRESSEDARLPIIIVISGIIGVGKTTLLNLLEKRGYSVLPERVEHWRAQNWLQEFYKDPEREALSFQLLVYDTGIENVEKALIASSTAKGGGKFGGETPGNTPAAKGGGGVGDDPAKNHGETNGCFTKLLGGKKVLFVERYLYDQLLFWKTQVEMKRVTKMQDDSYMSIWRRWRNFIPEPSGYVLLTAPPPDGAKGAVIDAGVESRGRPEELKASRDGDFNAYQRVLAQKHLEYFARDTACPPEAPRGGFPCLHVNIADYPYHKEENTGIVELIERWISSAKGGTQEGPK